MVVLLAALALFSQPRAASAEVSVFQVSGVVVDVTAATATEAREQAMADGHLLAYRSLMARLVLQGDRHLLPELSRSRIVDMVLDFSVAEERTSAVRYLAELSFRFNPDAVRDIFRIHGVRFTETRAKPLVVLPIFEAGESAGGETATESAVLLWEETNPWYLVWVRRLLDEDLAPLIVPLGDLGDVAAIDAERAVAGDSDALFGIAQRYGAEEALVARAVLSGDPEAGTANVNVSAERVGDRSELVFETRFAQQGPAPLADLLAVAAGQLIVSLREDWKAENHVSFDQQRVMTVVVPIVELNDWMEVKRRLDEVAAIMGLDLMYLSRKFARADISFIGDEERLIRALEQKDLMLAPSALSGWELRLSSRVFGDSEPLFLPQPEAMPAEEASPDVMSPDVMSPDAMSAEEMSADEMSAEAMPSGEMPSGEMMEELDGSAADSAPSEE